MFNLFQRCVNCPFCRNQYCANNQKYIQDSKEIKFNYRIITSLKNIASVNLGGGEIKSNEVLLQKVTYKTCLLKSDYFVD